MLTNFGRDKANTKTNLELSIRQNWLHEMYDLTGDSGSSILICANTSHRPHKVKSWAQMLINVICIDTYYYTT